MKKPIRVAITGAAGQIGYSLLFRIASGAVFGPDQPVELNLIEIEPGMKALEGVKMELDYCAFPLLNGIVTTCDLNEGFKGANWALLVGSVPRKKGMERSDLLGINGKIFIGQGQAIEKNAADDIRVLVVGNPCNTNCWIAMTHATNIPANRWFAMTRLDENRGRAQLAQKAGVHVNEVTNMTIWGNHSSTQYPDFYNAKIGGKPATASAANAAIDTVRTLVTPTPEGQWFSVGVCSDGSYGTPKGIITSLPVRSDGKNWEVVQGLEINEFSREKIDASNKELLDEQTAVKQIFNL